eukprot:scaffold4745_cov129-Skeletonema_menzelii.AAC.2
MDNVPKSIPSIAGSVTWIHSYEAQYCEDPQSSSTPCNFTMTAESADILPSSGPMTTISGVLESSRQALSIRRIFSLIGPFLGNRLG